MDLIETIRHFPLTRALRVDKTTIAGVQANLLHYLKGKAVEEIPLWQMITRPLEEIEALLDRPGRMTQHTLRLEPWLRPLHGHPRFEALLSNEDLSTE